jgi:adenylate cyclase
VVPAPERLDLAILGEQPTLTALEVAEETGVTVDQTRRLWRALGFPDQLGERSTWPST